MSRTVTRKPGANRTRSLLVGATTASVLVAGTLTLQTTRTDSEDTHLPSDDSASVIDVSSTGAVMTSASETSASPHGIELLLRDIRAPAVHTGLFALGAPRATGGDSSHGSAMDADATRRSVATRDRGSRTSSVSRSAREDTVEDLPATVTALVPEPHDVDAAHAFGTDAGQLDEPDPVDETSEPAEDTTTETSAPETSEEEATESSEPAEAEEAGASTVSSERGELWNRLGACESGHGGPAQWDHNRFHHLDPYSDARFYGGVHFNKSSWDWAVEVGGHDVAYWPHEASREQQIAVAETLLSIHPAGWGAWPECARQLGLR